MIIVVEGTDNAGKTTLALSLAKKTKAIYVKSENIPPKDEYVRQYSDILIASSMYGNGLVITDRHHCVSEPIYGPIVRGASSISPSICPTFLRQVGIFIYCRPGNKVITMNMNERQQMSGVVNNIEAIIQEYDKFFLSEGIKERTLRYDWTKDSEQVLVQEIKRHARFS